MKSETITVPQTIDIAYGYGLYILQAAASRLVNSFEGNEDEINLAIYLIKDSEQSERSSILQEICKKDGLKEYMQRFEDLATRSLSIDSLLFLGLRDSGGTMSLSSEKRALPSSGLIYVNQEDGIMQLNPAVKALLG